MDVETTLEEGKKYPITSTTSINLSPSCNHSLAKWIAYIPQSSPLFCFGT
jgi:hypothetical protein